MTTLGRWQGSVVIDTDDTLHLINTAELPRLYAEAADRGAAWFEGNPHTRTSLREAVRAYDNGLVELDSCACGDEPAVYPMGDGTLFGPACRSGAQGTRYDDKEAV